MYQNSLHCLDYDIEHDGFEQNSFMVSAVASEVRSCWEVRPIFHPLAALGKIFVVFLILTDLLSDSTALFNGSLVTL